MTERSLYNPIERKPAFAFQIYCETCKRTLYMAKKNDPNLVNLFLNYATNHSSSFSPNHRVLFIDYTVKPN
jgi:hypothetical protein